MQDRADSCAQNSREGHLLRPAFRLYDRVRPRLGLIVKLSRFAFLCALLAPAVAFAANGPAVLDLRSGTPKELLGKTLGIAMDLVVPCFLFGLLLEVFGQSPSKPRDYAGYGFRLLVFLVLLKFYGTIFGSVDNFTEGLANRVTPPDVWETFSNSHAQNFQKLWKKKSAADQSAEKAAAKGDND